MVGLLGDGCRRTTVHPHVHGSATAPRRAARGPPPGWSLTRADREGNRKTLSGFSPRSNPRSLPGIIPKPSTNDSSVREVRGAAVGRGFTRSGQLERLFVSTLKSFQRPDKKLLTSAFNLTWEPGASRHPSRR